MRQRLGRHLDQLCQGRHPPPHFRTILSRASSSASVRVERSGSTRSGLFWSPATVMAKATEQPILAVPNHIRSPSKHLPLGVGDRQPSHLNRTPAAPRHPWTIRETVINRSVRSGMALLQSSHGRVRGYLRRYQPELRIGVHRHPAAHGDLRLCRCGPRSLGMGRPLRPTLRW
jgi:hypothetical protein